MENFIKIVNFIYSFIKNITVETTNGSDKNYYIYLKDDGNSFLGIDNNHLETEMILSYSLINKYSTI